MHSNNTAAYIRVEGTLVKRGAFSLAAYLAANGQSFSERALRLGQLALTSPALGIFGQTDRSLANRATYVILRNMSEDRVRHLADEYTKEFLKTSVRQEGVALIRRLQKEGHRVVLLSETIEEVMKPLVDSLRLGNIELVCNRLEFRQSRATGKLLDPVVGGHMLATWVQAHAAESGVDLSQSLAYASQAPDLFLLAAVGKPCAVNPDIPLRRTAQESDWPVLELH